MANSQSDNKSQNGTLILILGILSLVLCAPLGIVAWVMGQKERKLYPDDSMVNTGWILGIIGTCLLILSFLILMAYILFFGVLFSGIFKELIKSNI